MHKEYPLLTSVNSKILRIKLLWGTQQTYKHFVIFGANAWYSESTLTAHAYKSTYLKIINFAIAFDNNAILLANEINSNEQSNALYH